MPNFREERQFLSNILDYQNIIIVGHSAPDADCIACQLVLQELFSTLGKNTLLVNTGPFKSREIQHYQDLFDHTLSTSFPTHSSIILLIDCADMPRTGLPEEITKKFPCAIIDHHPEKKTCRAKTKLIDKTQPASAVLVFHLFQASKVPISKTIAKLLFFALASDSGFFRFLNHLQTDALHMASTLMNYGVSPSEIYGQLNKGKSTAEIMLLANIIHRMKSLCDGKILLCHITSKERKKNLSSSLLFESLLSIEVVSIVVLMQELNSKRTKISFRSKGFNVQVLAKEYGGGGHLKAAGCILNTPYRRARKELIKRLNIIAFNKLT